MVLQRGNSAIRQSWKGATVIFLWMDVSHSVLYHVSNFLINRTNILLKDKLLPDFCHGFFWSEENADLNYFPTHDGLCVLVCPWILLGQMLILIDFMADVKPFLSVYYLDRCYCQELWQILCHFCLSRCYCPYIFEVVISHFWQMLGQYCWIISWLMLLPSFMAGFIANFYFRQMLLPWCVGCW